MTGSLPQTGRRAVLTAAAAGAVVAVGGCTRYGDTTAPAAPVAPPAPAAPAASGSDAAAPDAAAPPATESGAEPAASAVAVPALAALDRVPVGGGVILADEGIVLSRPARDRVVAFSATCTHQGCAVTTVTTDTVDCPCHGSRFRLKDGSVASGPASRPLDRVEVEVRDGQITRA